MNDLERYAELDLYAGFCPSHGCREGSLDKLGKTAYISVMKVVQRYLILNDALHIGICEDTLVQSEEEAKNLISFSEKNIRGAHIIIELLQCYHGLISFDRKIRFDGWVEAQQEELIEQLKMSGYQPRFRERERLETILKNLLHIEEFKKRLEELDSDKPWKDHLNFY